MPEPPPPWPRRCLHAAAGPPSCAAPLGAGGPPGPPCAVLHPPCGAALPAAHQNARQRPDRHQGQT
eukprot:365811-Chlamydomonas_euryale.AAC.23